MTPRIEILPPKKLIGLSIRMSLANDQTFALWSKFMPQRRHLKNVVSSEFFSMQVYDRPIDFREFTPYIEFTKWATIEVSEVVDLPEGFETYELQGGLYAVFIHKGTPADFPKTMQYIFGQWLPASNYELDHREHFELLGEKYKNNDPASEEEVWIPIRKKQ